jgi:hypothetical protein
VSREQIERFLLDERQKNRSRIPYVYVCSRQLPGKFIMSYLYPGVKLRQEWISVAHDGFKFRGKMFRSFNELVAWFKLHFNDPIPTNIVSQQMSAMTVSQQQPPLPPSPPKAAPLLPPSSSQPSWDMTLVYIIFQQNKQVLFISISKYYYYY